MAEFTVCSHFRSPMAPFDPRSDRCTTQCGIVAHVGLVWPSLQYWRTRGMPGRVCSRCLEVVLAAETANLLDPTYHAGDLLGRLLG